MTPWILAIGFAALSGLLEVWLSGPRPFAFLTSLKQPSWSLPIAGWLAVGAAFYVIMTFAMARSIETMAQSVIPLATVIAVMIADSFWNYLLFRRRRLDWAYWYLFAYTLLVIISVCAMFNTDRSAAILIATYLAFLPYDFAWTSALKRLNGQYAG